MCVCIYKSHQFIHLIYFYDLNLSRPGRSCSTSVMLILVIMTGVVAAVVVIHSTHGGPSSHTIPSIHRFGFVPFLTNPPKLLYIQSLFNFSCHTHTRTFGIIPTTRRDHRVKRKLVILLRFHAS